MADLIYPTGWRQDREDQGFLASGTKLFKGATPKAAIPDEFDPRVILRVENQANMGSCTGHAASTAFELDAYFASGGKAKPQHSRMFAYLGAQEESNMLGRDQGATIAGAVQSLVGRGVCLESSFPYPSRYTSKFPAGSVAEAGKFKVKNHSPLRTYDLVWQWLTGGFGGVVIGIVITTNFQDSKGILTLSDLTRGRALGGHALCLCGWSKRIDAKGRHYIWLANSWGTEWGVGGYAEVEPDAIDAIGSDRDSEMQGITGATSYDRPRRVVGDWGRVVA